MGTRLLYKIIQDLQEFFHSVGSLQLGVGLRGSKGGNCPCSNVKQVFISLSLVTTNQLQKRVLVVWLFFFSSG